MFASRTPLRVGNALPRRLMAIGEVEKTHLCDGRLDNAKQCRGIESGIKHRDHVEVTFEVFLMVMEEKLRGCYLEEHGVEARHWICQILKQCQRGN